MLLPGNDAADPEKSLNEMQSLRSGQIKVENVYTFSVPTNWSQEQVANIKSGNFCMVWDHLQPS